MRSAILLLSLLVFGPAALAQTAEPPHVITSGDGVIKVIPDQAWVSVGSESRSKVSKDAQQRNAQVMTAIQQKLSSFNIPKDAIKTTAVDLQLEQQAVEGLVHAVLPACCIPACAGMMGSFIRPSPCASRRTSSGSGSR